MVKTPAILQFTSPFTYSGFQVGLSPVASSGPPDSQPLPYYVDKKQRGSVIASSMRPESLVALMAVFPSNDSRRRIFECNSAEWSDLTRAGHCCDSFEACNIGSAYGRTSCTKVPVSNLTTQMSSYGAVVMLAPTHGLCQFNWKAA